MTPLAMTSLFYANIFSYLSEHLDGLSLCNEDTGGGVRPPNLKMLKKPSPIGVNVVRNKKWKVFYCLI